MNFADIINAVAKVLEEDNALNLLVDGQIISGFRRAMADDYLGKPNHACIGVRNLVDLSRGLPGCAYHGVSKHNQLIEIRVITLTSTTRQDDYYAGQIADRIERVLKGGVEKVLNATSYQLLTGDIAFTPLDVEELTDRIEVQSTVRLQYHG